MALIVQSQQDYYDGSNYGNYQFTSLDTIINQFMIAYVGESKIISKARRSDVAFHAHRALQELSFDVFKSFKGQEYEVPSHLTMPLPQDYVNYTKISWIDDSGIKHPLYPTNKTSNPPNPFQNSDGGFNLKAKGTLTSTLSYITLDGEYLDVTVGMKISSPSIASNNVYVGRIDYSAGIATVYLFDGPNSQTATPVFPASTTTETVTFEGNSDLLLEATSKVLLTGVSWAATDNKITVTSAASVEIGMVISNEYFPPGTSVVSIDGTTLTVNNTSTNTAAVTSDDMTFLAYKNISTTWDNYKSTTPAENNNDNYEDDVYWPNNGERYGLEPSHAQVNGSFYIDQITGKIHFSSNISGKTVVLDYISDSLGTANEMQVHKFAEEAMYKWILYAILSTRVDIQDYIVRRFKKEKFAEVRKAKLRLSNIKLEEITQILRGKSKQIKH